MEPEPPAPARHRGLRRAGGALLAVGIAIGGVLLLLIVFQGRDSSQLHQQADASGAPGQAFADQGNAHLRAGQRPSQRYASDPPTSGPHVPVAIRSDGDGTRVSDDQLLQALELGDVVLLYGGARPPAALRALADRLAGPFDPALAASGEAVLLARRTGTQGVVAVAWRHLLRTRSASDPALERFASYWLGRGVGG
jgi:hypothetical protein